MDSVKVPIRVPEIKDDSVVPAPVVLEGGKNRLFGMDIIPDSIKRFVPQKDNILIAVMQEALVMSLLTNKVRPDSKDLRYICTMVVSVGELVKGIAPGDVVFIASNEDGHSRFGLGNHVPFVNNVLSAGYIASEYAKKENGEFYKETEIRRNEVAFDIMKRERIVGYYCIGSYIAMGVFPEEYKKAFNIPMDHKCIMDVLAEAAIVIKPEEGKNTDDTGSRD